ncbi:XLF-domain-containing protein, partial [Aureobasidium melanogenum]
MGTEGHWELLNLNLEGLPKLLVKYVVGAAGYTVSITDLANIWIETLANVDVIRNAEIQNCSINPGDDGGQLRILLEQIRDILRHKHGTTVHLALQPPDHLRLALRAPLPPPLPPFEWNMVLTKATSIEVVSEVISPLLVLAHQQQQQLSFLLGQLKDKDHAMSRLLDKMEATNTDLGSVFPGVSAGRNSQKSLKRSHVANRVPGLAPFQPGSELQYSGDVPSTEALYAVLRDVPGDMAPSITNTYDAWWQNMPNQQESIEVSVPMPSILDDDETDDDLDFQTIPEQLQRQMPANISSPVRSSRRVRRHISANGDSTDDGRVTSSPPLPPALRNFRLGQTETPAPDSPSKRSNTQTRRIGAIGARSSSQALPASSPPKPPADIEPDHGLRSRTMLSPTPSSMLPPQTQSQASPSRKRRLGGIGRGSSQMQPSLSRWSSQAPPILEEDQQDSTDLDLGLTSTARESREDTTETYITISFTAIHQEFILVKLCEGATSLAHFDKHQQKHNPEVATGKALPTNTTPASSCAAKLDFCTTEPSIVLTGQVDHSIYPSSSIIHIIVSAMALDTHEMSDHEQEFAQEAERRYNDIISGGKPPAYYKAIEIQLQQVLDRVRQLSDLSSSAAVRLQQLHEHNDQSSSQASSISPSTSDPVLLENFPALSLTIVPRSDAPTQSYAKVVKNSLPQQPLVVTHEHEPQDPVGPRTMSPISSNQDEDGDWYVVDRSGRGTRSQKPRALATERHARKSIPKAWMQVGDDAQAAQFTSEDASMAPHSSPNKSLQRTTRVKGPHTQLAQAHANLLKSKPSKPTLTRTTASKTLGYASPTKASKHRTVVTSESARSPSPCKSKTVRADTMSRAAISPLDQSSPTRSVASAVFDASRRKVLSAHGKYPSTSIPFGLDGACDFDQSSLLQTFSGNSVHPPKKAKLGLRINIPEPSSSLPRPGSPSRIPIAVPPSSPAADSELTTPDRMIVQAVEPAEADRATVKPVDRASILEPIRRRLSSASSSSQQRSSASSTERPRKDSGASQPKETALVEGDPKNKHIMFKASEVNSTQTQTQQPSNTVVSSLTSSLEPASTLLLDTIKQTAEAHAVRQGISQIERPVAPMHEAHEAKKLHEFQAACRSQHISCASSPEKDPAVLRCGPVKADPSTKKTRSTSGPARFSLRATAAHFIPAPISNDAYGPLSAPEPSFGLPLPPVLPNLAGPTLPSLVGPALGFAPPAVPELLPICSPILPMAISQKAPQQLATQCPSAVDGYSSWIPEDEWYDLRFEAKTAILRERKERRSSSASSPGLSSAMFSNFTTSPSLSSLGPVADTGMTFYKPQWDWMNPGQNGIRFGRAPLPIMPDLQDDGYHRKGWDVKSAAPGWRYGWRGGDGLEISFKGDGPVAERNPNAPINFNEYDTDLYGKPTKKGHKFGDRNWSKKNGGSPNSRVREWARNANYPSVPCGNFEVIQATEHLPSFSDAWCHNCLPAHV